MVHCLLDLSVVAVVAGAREAHSPVFACLRAGDGAVKIFSTAPSCANAANKLPLDSTTTPPSLAVRVSRGV